jgi:membrane protease YdiL (CAAX protease family)
MSTVAPLIRTDVPSRSRADRPAVVIPQYGRRGILAVWAAATLPMAALAWLVAPALADRLSGAGHVPMAKALLLVLTAGLAWQFVLVAVLVGREQGNLRWSTLREALWLRAPRSPRTGRTGGRVWLIVIPLTVAFAAESFIRALPHPDDRNMGLFIESAAGQEFLNGAWGWFGLVVALGLFNTVLGEELLFRGFLLPRMNGAFGRRDWLANGVLFAVYHLHVPWIIPVTLLDTFILAYPAKRYRSAWIPIAVHSVQTVFVTLIVLAIVL